MLEQVPSLWHLLAFSVHSVSSPIFAVAGPVPAIHAGFAVTHLDGLDPHGFREDDDSTSTQVGAESGHRSTVCRIADPPRRAGGSGDRLTNGIGVTA
jgi:hypothetical protein